MMALLILKSRIKNFYERHYRVARGIIKVCLVFVVLLTITQQLDYDTRMGAYWILAGLSFVCGIVPDMFSFVTVVCVTLGELYFVSPALSVVVMLILIVYYLLFGRLTEKQGTILAAIPILFVFHLEYVVPVVAALFCSPVMIPALITGVLLHFLLEGAQNYALTMSRTTEEVSPVASLQYVAEYLRGNTLALVVLGTFLLTFVCVYLIRRTKIQYASQVAILAGGILILSCMLSANLAFNLDVNLLTLLVAIFISLVIALIIRFFYNILDYRGTRKLQFEDDEYYYYVTAVPKYKVTVVDKTVTRIGTDEEEDTMDLQMELEKELEDMN